MTSLITTVRTKFLESIRSVNPPGKWKILVVDEHSQRLLNTVLKQFDILEENVTLIESISNAREPQQFEAIYLLMPTTKNIEILIRDFSNGNRQYSAAHLFFIDGLSEALFGQLTSSPAEPYLKSLKDLYLNFTATEAQTFSVNAPETFFSLYSPPRDERSYQTARDRVMEDLRFISTIIANVCITFNEYPYIRYYVPSNHPPLGALKPHETTRPPPPEEGSGRWRTNLARGSEARAHESVEGDYLTKVLAFMTQKQLDEHKKQNPDFGKQATRERGTLIITDRSMDMMSPFIHEFTYQAMANDLLPIRDGKTYTYKFQSAQGAYEDKTSTLTDADSVWAEVRHMHMREAIDKLMADFNKFLEDNAGFKGEGAANLNDMKDMLANLPQYKEQREKFSLHLNIAQECMGLFESDKLPLVANVEQCCATGLTAEGKTPKSLVEEMVPLLDSREVINANKVRVIALYIQFRDGVPDEDRRRLYQHARLTLAEQDAVNALLRMGVRISRASGDKDIKKKLKQKPADDEYELSRFKPLLKTVVEDHVANRLDSSLFPYVKDTPLSTAATASLRAAPPVASPATSLRSQKPAWHKAASARGAPGLADTKQRVIVFVAGGMTYAESREVYKLSAALNKDVFLGSTHTITPGQFVDDLKVLDMQGVGSRAVPNGVPDNRGGQRPFQAFYDDRYFIKDPPPVRKAPPPASSSSGRTRNDSNNSGLAIPRDGGKERRSPTPSYAESSGTTNSVVKEEKKKKRGLFRF
ncbi:Sec1-like protein [Pterulicium gracile]|uniref:Sec1-like protein n=1 Tax=Pterulicium gracile TaxID=1884261 RepID=A0A5C3QKA6_9AGAR|nr:Sec1-like protein [Pterula gracilis]